MGRTAEVYAFWLTISVAMQTDQMQAPKRPTRLSDQHPGRAGWLRIAMLLAALGAIGSGLYKYFEAANELAIAENPIYMPATNPPVDPNRPDLIGE